MIYERFLEELTKIESLVCHNMKCYLLDQSCVCIGWCVLNVSMIVIPRNCNFFINKFYAKKYCSLYVRSLDDFFHFRFWFMFASFLSFQFHIIGFLVITICCLSFIVWATFKVFQYGLFHILQVSILTM